MVLLAMGVFFEREGFGPRRDSLSTAVYDGTTSVL